MKKMICEAADDGLVLEMVRGTAGFRIAQSVGRLYETGQISDNELVASVERGLITLADYNDIIERI